MDNNITSSNSLLDKSISSFTFIEALVLIVVGWILITLWERFVLNVFYQKLKFNPKSTMQTFAIALTVTAIFLIFLRYVGPLVLGTYNESIGVNSPGNIDRTKFI